MAHNLTEEEVVEFWRRYRAGEPASVIARRFGIRPVSVHQRINKAGGITPLPPRRAPRQLTVQDREEISRGLAAGESLRQIAGRLGRAPSTISREVAANGGRSSYRALRADRAAAASTSQAVQACGLAAAASGGRTWAASEVVS